ncbi:MAG TPA: hypothetical protein VN739_00915 [Nitrososphaerales archaeon]|nr:hypothetical protein [Nitrososphaerales archaeon]
MNSYLQIGNDPVALVEWFVASVAIVFVVTLLYVFVLGKSPPPEGLTEAKLEMQIDQESMTDNSSVLAEAHTALSGGDLKKAIELSVRASSLVLSRLLRAQGIDPSNMNVSDMAYIFQTKSPGRADITQPIYQLNLLHLKAAKGEPINAQEAEWSINTAVWVSELTANLQN